MGTPVHLLETTLRDGSYEIEFQFTTADTALLTSALDRAGVKYIELCHGNGIGCDVWGPKYRSPIPPAASDEEHLRAARATRDRAILGVFMMVGADFAPPSYLDILPRHGIDFVRFGIRPDLFDEPSVWLPYLEYAKKIGLIVSINLMSTPALPIEKVALSSRDVAERGADWYYIVDSAGEMTPALTQDYVRAIREASGLPVGLHAHNNGGLALANSLAAVAAGATFVDGTLQGIGRATGNAGTENLLLALQRLGHETEIDRDAIFSLGDLARALFAEKGNDPTCFASGAAGVHSRGVPTLRKIAEERGRSTREFILRVGVEIAQRRSRDRDLFAPQLIEKAVEETPPVRAPVPSSSVIEIMAGDIAALSGNDLTRLGEDLFSRSFKRRKISVLHLVPAAEFSFAVALAWESGDLVGVTVPVIPPIEFPTLAARAPEFLVIDDAFSAEKLPSSRQPVIRHSFQAWVADAVTELIMECREGQAAVWLPEPRSAIAKRVADRLNERGVALGEGAQVVVAAGSGEWITRVGTNSTVILLPSSEPAQPLIDAAGARGAKVLRPLLSSAIAGRIASLVQLRIRLGQTPPAGSLVDPFVAPTAGQTVVDSTSCPSQIIDPGTQSVREEATRIAAFRASTLLAGRGRI